MVLGTFQVASLPVMVPENGVRATVVTFEAKDTLQPGEPLVRATEPQGEDAGLVPQRLVVRLACNHPVQFIEAEVVFPQLLRPTGKDARLLIFAQGPQGV